MIQSLRLCSLVRVRAPPKINWIQLCILIIGVFIGVAGFIATITLCCLYSKYKRRIRRSNIKIVEAPVRALIPASLPPGSTFIQFSIRSLTWSHLSVFFTLWFRVNNGSTGTVTDGRSSLRAGGTIGHWQQWQV